MEPGPFSLIGLFILLPLFTWQEASQRFRTLSPEEQNLTRAGNGFAGLYTIIAALFWFYRARSIDDLYAKIMAAQPLQKWIAGLLLLLAVVSAIRFVVGVRRCWGLRDGILATRAFAKLACGVGGVWFLREYRNKDGLHLEVWQAMLWTALMCWAIWWLLAGGVRFLLLVIGGSTALKTLQDFLKKKNAPMRPAMESSESEGGTGAWSRPGNIFEKIGAQLKDEIAGIPQYWRNFRQNFIPSVHREFADEPPVTIAGKVLGWVWVIAFVAFIVCINNPSIRRSWGLPNETLPSPTPITVVNHAKHHRLNH